MATKRSQRIGIWIIAIALLVGTLGSFLVLILAPQNEAADQARLEALSAEYQKEYEIYQEKVNAQASELSDQYYEVFKPYESRVAEFDADETKELVTHDLKTGEGEELTNESSFTAYYIGWSPKGEVFDSSFNESSLKAPIAAEPGGVIKGWTEGVAGMRVGGVRELTIPSDMAYGEAGSGEAIPPNTPLKFVIMVIPTPERIEEPEVPDELLRLYQRMNGF